MNFGSDERVRNAFRATLLDEPSSSSLGTQELDAADVLEVTDLATAIARAEEVIRAQSSRALFSCPDSSGGLEDSDDRKADDRARSKPGAAMDMFDRLVATDDTAGPAVHAPYLPTLLPRPTWSAAPVPTTALPVNTVPQAWSRPFGEAERLAETMIPPALRTAPILILDEDAFYHPAGRIRSFADVTLESYRPEPTLMLRLRQRRQTLSRIVLVVLASIALFALFAAAIGFGRARVERAPAQPAATTATTPAATAAPRATTIPPTPARADEGPAAAAEVPALDVNSLKSAPPAKPQR